METRKIKVQPSKKQYQALMILIKDNWVSFLWYGWAAWWGKTILAAMWISMMCMRYPQVRYWVFRRFITDCLDTTFKSFLKALLILWLREASTIDELKRHPDRYDFCVRNWWKEIVFLNGSEIWFRGLQDKPTDIHFTKIWWLELTGAFADEANEQPEQWISILKKRIGRHMNKEYNIPRKFLCTFNPDKWWVYRNFYLPYKNKNESEWTMFIPALPTDNPYLTEEYLYELEHEENDVIKQRLYYGNFEYDDTPGRLFWYKNILNLWNNAKQSGNRYISCDVARFGKDKTVIMVWNGWNVEKIVELALSSTKEVAEEILKLQTQYSFPLENVIVDEDGVWWGVVDQLWCRGFINNSRPISPLSASKMQDRKRNYKNLKTQCYFLLADRVNDGTISIDPDFCRDKLVQELDIIVQTHIDDDTVLQIISKDEIKEKIGRSPDYSDALMMRMFFDLNTQWPGWAVFTFNSDIVSKKSVEITFDSLFDEEEETVQHKDPSLSPY